MLSKLLLAFTLMAVCVAIHAMGLVGILKWVHTSLTHSIRGFWPSAWQLIWIAALTILLHLTQILVWAAVYTIGGALKGYSTAAYFSAVTYTTTGYGDLVLPEEWRLVGGVEALTGILMCGLSTGMFFAVFSRIFRFGQAHKST